MTDMPFVGRQREQLVGELVERFDEVRDTRRPQLVTIEAPLGWGKTTILREFYRRLAATQAPPGYWPPEIEVDDAGLGRRGASVYPRRVEVSEGAGMEWFWWGVRCGDPRSETDGLVASGSQFRAHTDALLSRVGRRGEGWKETVEFARSLYSMFGLPDPVEMVLDATEVADSLGRLGRRLRSVAGHRRAGARERVIDLDAVSTLRQRVEALVEAVVGLASYDLPMVVVVDDAHRADPALVSFVEKLLADATGPVFVAATAWPEVLALQAETDARQTFGWMLDRCPGEIERRSLEPLDVTDLESLAAAAAPELPAPVLVAAAERSSGNPFTLKVVLTTLFHGLGRPEDVTVGDVEGLPPDLAGLFRQHWREVLEPAVRHVLVLAALQGERFVGECVEELAQMLDVDEPAATLARAEDPYGWITLLDRDRRVAGFRERVLWEVADEHRHEVRGRLDEARAALVGYVERLRRSDAWDDLDGPVRRVLLSSQVALHRDHRVGAVSDAAEAALELARLDAAEWRYEAAADHASLALAWGTEAQLAADFGWECRERLAKAYRALGDDRARREFASLREDMGERLGADDPRVLQVAMAEATVSLREGRLSEAAARFDAIGDAFERAAGPDDPGTVRARYLWALARSRAGYPEEAIPVLSKVIDAREAMGGEAGALSAENALATAYSRNGLPKLALAHYERVYERRKEVRGENHPETLVARTNIGVRLRELHRTAEAIALFDDVLRLRRRRAPETSPTVLIAKHNLGVARLLHGDVEAAIDLLSETAVQRDARLGPEHHSSRITRRWWGIALGTAGRWDEAVELLDDLVARLGDDEQRRDHPRALNDRAAYGWALTGAGRADEAVPVLEAVVAAWEAKGKGSHPDAERARGDLAEARSRS